LPGRAAICGLVVALAGGGGLFAACSAKTSLVDVAVTAYVPRGCGDAGGARVTFTGLGDFPQTTAASEVVTLGATDAPLSALPAETRQIVLTPVSDAGPWAGSALVPDGGPVNVLTLPLGRACSLSVQPGTAFTNLGLEDPTHALVLGGSVPYFVVDLGTGVVTQFPSSFPSLNNATVSPFGADVLIAGGYSLSTEEAQQTAHRFTPLPSGLPPAPPYDTIELVNVRTQHTAVTLPDGRVLLVGGWDLVRLLPDIEILDPRLPATDGSKAVTATLVTGRLSPTVLALPNGQVFVGGGTDTSGRPVDGVEWLGPNPALAGDYISLGAGTLCNSAPAEGFAPTEGGSVLAVIGTQPTAGCSNVHLLRPWGSAPDRAVIEDAPGFPFPNVPTTLALLDGAEASPLLIADGAIARWNPWTATFAPLGSTGATVPVSAALSFAPSPGLALWIGEDGSVYTFRFDTHGEYATDVAHGPYLVTDDQFTAPDRLLDGGFNAGEGARLPNGATAWISDETFAAVTASVGLPDGGSASLVLRDPAGREVVCGATAVAALGSVELVRAGASVSATADGTALSCSGSVDAGARVAVGVRGPDAGISVVRSLAVVR
jgi:hypothetical protein